MTIKLSKDNIKKYIEQDIVYRTTTPSGWGMITAIHGENDYTVTDLPDVQKWLDEIEREKQETANKALDVFKSKVRGLRRVLGVNQMRRETRVKFGLFEGRIPAGVVTDMRAGDWDWYVPSALFEELKNSGEAAWHFDENWRTELYR